MIYRCVGYLIFSIASYFVAERWLHGYSYSDYKDYLALLAGLSGMVFTIMGIWIAFLYPNAMSRIVSPERLVARDFSESRSDAKRLESIVGAVMISALIMLAILFITLLKMIVMMLPLYLVYKEEIKSGALAVVVLMTLIQMESVINVVISNIMFINDLHFRRQARQSDEEL
jgi:uncharacterized membrane protein